MKFSNILGLFIIFTLSSYFVFGQTKNLSTESILVESKIRLYCFQEAEYAVLKISYENISKDTLYLWTQNWRVHYLKEQDSGKFKNCPYDINGGYLNAITFFKSFPRFYSKSSRFSYFDAGDTILNCSFVKRIFPGETFYTNIIFSDTSFVSHLKKDKPDYILLHYSYASNFKPNLELPSSFYYQDDEFFINYELNPDSVNCETNNVVSKNGISQKSHDSEYQAAFNITRIILDLSW